MNKHYFYAEDWDLMKKLMRRGIRLYCEEQGLSNDKDFRIVSLSTKGDWGHILNFSRCCDYPLNQDRKWEPFDAYYGKVYCDEEEIKNIIPKNDDKLKELLKQIRDSGIDSKTIINALVNNKNESMDINEAKEILNEHGFVLNEGYSKDKFIICGIFDCNGTMKKLYYHRMSENWTDDLFEATEFVEFPVQNLIKAKTINTSGTKDTLGCKSAKLDHIEVLQVKTMGTGYRKNIKIIDKQVFK